MHSALHLRPGNIVGIPRQPLRRSAHGPLGSLGRRRLWPGTNGDAPNLIGATPSRARPDFLTPFRALKLSISRKRKGALAVSGSSNGDPEPTAAPRPITNVYIANDQDPE